MPFIYFLSTKELRKINITEPVTFFDLIVYNKTQMFDEERLRNNTTINNFLNAIVKNRMQEAYEIIMNLENSKEFGMVVSNLKKECNF